MFIDAYRAEYESTPITLEELATKYSLTQEDLKDASTWKAYSPPATIVPAPRTLRAPAPTTSDLTVTEKIEKFKEDALEHCLTFMSQQAEFAEVKEFKDIVAIVDSIEKSYKSTKDTGPTINIMIQNLMERFSDDV
jgi:hypothetical protein